MLDRPPRVARVQGTGRLLLEGDDDYDELDPLIPTLAGARAIIEVRADRVATSCGYSVPLMELVDQRDTLERWASAKTDAGLDDYRARKNARSIDGLPAFAVAGEGTA